MITLAKREPVLNEVPLPMRQNPDLNSAVLEAKKRFEQLIDEHDLHEAKRELLWGYGDLLQSHDFISLTVNETDELGRRDATRATNTRGLLDPLRRDGMLLGILGDLLQKRWRKVNDKLILNLRELEASELEHAH